MKLLKCIRGMHDDTNVFCLQGDIVKVVDVNEGLITIEGVEGWCVGWEFEFSAKEIASSFSWHSDTN